MVWDQKGFIIYYKRLEKGTFELPSIEEAGKSVKITHRTLMLILEGNPLTASKKCFWVHLPGPIVRLNGRLCFIPSLEPAAIMVLILLLFSY